MGAGRAPELPGRMHSLHLRTSGLSTAPEKSRSTIKSGLSSAFKFGRSL
jgi:hypothetical protein